MTEKPHIFPATYAYHPLSSNYCISYRFRSPCWICGGQNGTWTGVSQSTLLFPCQYYSTPVFDCCIADGELS
jgi:hypothetical protein